MDTWYLLDEPPKKERNSCISSAREESSPIQQTNFSYGKAGQGITYSSLRSSTKRQGWESPDRPGVESILSRRVGATFIRELL